VRSKRSENDKRSPEAIFLEQQLNQRRDNETADAEAGRGDAKSQTAPLVKVVTK